MRRSPTSNEARLWALLRDRKLQGLKFRRQVPIGPYVADFMSFRHRLVIEADGPTHLTNADHDQRRDDWLRAQGFRVLRFRNEMIACDSHGVLEVILDAVTPPGPIGCVPFSPCGRMIETCSASAR
jgi:very-short-patch-repair endonuclease